MSLKESRAQIGGIIDLLKHFSSESVHLLNINEGGSGNSQDHRARLEKLAAELMQLGFEVEISFRSGHVASAICDYADAQNADFIILPWKTKMIVQRALLGNTVRDVIRLSNRPVAVYRATRHSSKGATTGISRIMYATAFKATDHVVMPYLQCDGIKADTLYLLNVGRRAPDPDAEKKRKERVNKNLAKLAEQCRDCYERVEKIAVLGRPYKQILQKARSEAVDLIVAGKYDKASPFSSMLGSIAEHLPHRSPCSILIIPLESLAVTQNKNRQ
ncbi:MAG: universal stress protein [Lentisphaeria bacterium]